MVHRVEHQFDAAGDAELVKNPKQMLLNGMFAQTQLARSLAIAETVGHQGNRLLFPPSQEIVTPAFTARSEGTRVTNVEQVLQLLSVRPDLSAAYSTDALAKCTEGSAREGEETSCAGTKSIDDQIAIIGLSYQDLGKGRMSQVHAAEDN